MKNVGKVRPKRAEEAERRECRANPSLKREILTELHAPGILCRVHVAKSLDQAVEMMSPWYRQIFRTRLASHRNAVQEFITTTSLSCSAGSQRPPSSAANRNPLRPCTPPARWNGSPRRTKLAEPLRRSATAIHRRQPRRAIKELHRWRPDRAIAARERALRLPDHTPLASRPVAIVEPPSRPAHG